METLLYDLRFAFRLLRKSPGFTLVAILTLALGIGANTAIFTVVNAVILRPLPVKDLDHLVAVMGTDTRNNIAQQQYLPISFLNYRDLHDKNDVLSDMAAMTGTGVNLSGTGNPDQLNAALVTANYFDILGVRAALGNTFDVAQAKKEGGYPVVVLNYGLWQRRFGGDRAIIGRSINLNQQPFTVIGVMPKSFTGTFAVGTPELWIATAEHEQILTGDFKRFFNERRPLIMFCFGRLKPGVTMIQAESELKNIATQLAKDFPDDNGGRNVRLLPLAQTTVDPNNRGLFLQAGALLMGVVGLVLLIACANLANLLLVRGADRRRELAVRMSMGAGRGRLLGLLLSESLLLSLLGGLAGLGLATGFRNTLVAFRPPFLNPDDLDLTMDTSVLLFTLGVAVVTALAFGALPAWQAVRFNLSETLKEAGGRSGSAGGRHTLRGALIVAEITLSVIALVGAGLFLSSLRNAQDIDPGFQSKNLVVMNFDLGAQNYRPDQGLEFQRRLMERLRAIPMVRSASLATAQPLGGAFQRTVFPEGADPSDRRNGVLTAVNQIDANFFQTVGTPLLRGRDFTESDREGSALVAIVNQSFVNKFFPGQDALGKHFRCFGETWNLEIVGIARDSKVATLGEDPTAEFYLPLLQHYSPTLILHVRTAGEPGAALPTIRSTVQEMDSQMPLTQVLTGAQILDQALYVARFGALLLLAFGLLALILAAVGIYGVMSYTVEQRRQEMGIRIALGAQTRDVLGLVLGRGMLLAGIGAAAGLLAAFFMSRAITALLFNVRALDPVTFSAVPAVLLSVALLACYIPARRATHVDPLEALRNE